MEITVPAADNALVVIRRDKGGLFLQFLLQTSATTLRISSRLEVVTVMRPASPWVSVHRHMHLSHETRCEPNALPSKTLIRPALPNVCGIDRKKQGDGGTPHNVFGGSRGVLGLIVDPFYLQKTAVGGNNSALHDLSSHRIAWALYTRYLE